MKTILLTALLLTTPAMAQEFSISSIDNDGKFVLHDSTLYPEMKNNIQVIVGYWTFLSPNHYTTRWKIAVVGCEKMQGWIVMGDPDGGSSKTYRWISSGPAVYDGMAVAQCTYYHLNRKTY